MIFNLRMGFENETGGSGQKYENNGNAFRRGKHVLDYMSGEEIEMSKTGSVGSQCSLVGHTR